MTYKYSLAHIHQVDKVGVKMSTDNKTKRMKQITIKLKVDDLNRLKDYADKKGGNPVSHYIREAISEYLEIHYPKN